MTTTEQSSTDLSRVDPRLDPDPVPLDHALATWQHDGAVVIEQNRPEVYLVYGNARFHIGSPDELTALGLSWAQVVTVPDGATTSLARVPDVGTLLRVRDAPAIWLSVGDRLWWVPTGEAMRFLNLDWNRVHIVPSGSLDGLPRTQAESASSTPASSVFSPDPPKKWPRVEVPGYSLPNGARVVELRGWLRAVLDIPNGADPDWHLQLEPDPAWLDQIGVNWSTFYKVGDTLSMGLDPLTDDADLHGRVATPTVHMEVNGWQDDKHPGVARPLDWDVDKVQGGQLDGVVWPFLPTVTGGRPGNEALVSGDYVRVVGSLVHDIPHDHQQGGGWVEWWKHNVGIGPGSGAYFAAAQDWDGPVAELDQSNPSRWSEVHPPDLVEKQDDPGRREAVFGLVAVARAVALNPFGLDTAVTVDLRPPGQRPAHCKAAVVEYVGPETRYQSITEGNAGHSGAAIGLFPDHAHVHVKVHGDGLAGLPGKFKATYRLSWQPDPASYRLRVSAEPSALPGGVPVTFTVSCTDAETGDAVAGAVSSAGETLGSTGQPITHTFQGTRKRVWVPDPGAKPPGHWEWVGTYATVTVAATSYPSAVVPLSIGADDGD